MLAEDIATRVGYFGMGDYISHFGWLTAALTSRQSVSLERFVVPPPVGLPSLMVFRVAKDKDWALQWDNVAIARVEFPKGSLLPFHLVWHSETVEGAASKLSTDKFLAGSKVSYFMPEDLVISLHFVPNLVGLERVIAARLGPARDWRDKIS